MFLTGSFMCETLWPTSLRVRKLSFSAEEHRRWNKMSSYLLMLLCLFLTVLLIKLNNQNCKKRKKKNKKRENERENEKKPMMTFKKSKSTRTKLTLDSTFISKCEIIDGRSVLFPPRSSEAFLSAFSFEMVSRNWNGEKLIENHQRQ